MHQDERTAARRLLEELARDRTRLQSAPAPWLRWWDASGQAELRCILMAGWDPVGANDAGWDEYDGYLPGIGNLVRAAPDVELAATPLAEHLTHITRDFMGIGHDEQRHQNRVAAELIVHWYRWSSRERRTNPRSRRE